MNATVIPERDFDLALARWVRQRSGSDLLARAAGAVSQAEAQGHVRCDLVADAGFSAQEIEALRAQAWVGNGDAFAPFVCADAANLYTWRNWFHETRLAQALRERAAARTFPLDAQTLAADMNELFAGMDAQATHWQRAAVAAVAGARVFVLTGGPGTGKTTTVLRMLLMLLKHARACGLPARPAIALAAPTGKAAQRLSESVAREASRLESTQVGDSAFVPYQGADVVRVAYQPAEVTRKLAWREREIILRQETLSDAAAEFNRYNDVQIVINDPVLGRERLVGGFRVDAPDSFARAVHAALDAPVSIGDGRIVIGAAGT